MSTSRLGHIIAPLLALALAACAGRPDPEVSSVPAGTGAASTAASNMMQVTVNHTDMNRSELTVYIEPTGGVRKMIGTLSAGEQKTFTYEVTGNRNVRLVGVSPSADAIQSLSITVPPGSGLYWEVGLNSVRLRR